MFHAVARAFQDWLGQPVSMKSVRQELALSITSTTVRAFIADVQEDHSKFLPHGATDWNSVEFETEDALAVSRARTLVNMTGRSLQGTDVLLKQMVHNSPFWRRGRIGCVVVNAYGPGFSSIYPKDPQKWYILLYCANNAHWQAATVKVDGRRVGVLTLSQLASLFRLL